MKFKRTVLLAIFVVTMGLLLGASAAQAEPIVNLDGDTATGIQNLDVGGTLYNVAFLFTSADDLYGTDPIFDFTDVESAKAAKIAVNTALNLDNRATKVGPSSDQGVPDYGIGYEKPGLIKIQNANYVAREVQAWVDADVDVRVPSDLSMYADFTLAGPSPDPVFIGGSVTGLVGSDLVLQNNGGDDESIADNGEFTFDTPLTPGNSYNVTVLTNPTNPAQTCIVEYGSGQVPTEDVTDVAVSCVEAPEPVTIGGSVTGLVEGSDFVLQNLGKDDLTITENDDFTFATPRTPGSFYDVTVLTNPTNPAQTCIVDNGSGTVPLEDVTDVAVSCTEAPVSDVIKVAAEGDTLGGTLLTQILLDGGVAINISGKVAFGGRDDDRTDAAFTQDGKVVAEGDTLPDDTILAKFRGLGEVAINVGQSGDKVAFHGEAEDGFNDTDAVFTQAGMVAAVGDPLPEGTLDQIKDQGKVAINDFDLVAFHGKIKVEGGLFDERLDAVFTSDGLFTVVAVREGDTLGDNTVESIDYTGGVAINDFDEVAFHGDVVDPDAGVDTLKAVFTSAGLVAKEGDTLNDGNTIVDDIDENGGVAINIFGDVAFHGDVVAADAGTDTVRAVFTQEGLVAKEGLTLPDDTFLEEISESGGVAINFFGDVAFHGRTGDVKAVFTQNGLVAKEGDTLADGTILGEIHNNGGVAINFFGEVAFHGKVGTTDAVFIGKASDPPADGDESSSE